MLYKLILSKKKISKKILFETLLKYLKKEEKEEVAKVFYYVMKKYEKKDLKRANGYPAEIHLLQVAEILDFDLHLIKLALLHDILEDIPNNNKEKNELIKEIKTIFGNELLKSLIQLTKNKEENYEKYVKRLNNIDAIIVKEADMLNNIRTSLAKKSSYIKYKQPKKLEIFIKHLDTIKLKNNLYKLIFLKYYTKIIEEFFRVYEVQIKMLKEQHKSYCKDILFFENLLIKYYFMYTKKRKEIHKQFIDKLISSEYQKYFDIELKKRINEALISIMPLHSMIISIDQNLYFYKKTKNKLLQKAIIQQIKLGILEATRLKNYYKILLENKSLLNIELTNKIINPEKKVKVVREAIKRLKKYGKSI